jgi:hypothetical protein
MASNLTTVTLVDKDGKKAVVPVDKISDPKAKAEVQKVLSVPGITIKGGLVKKAG